MWMNTIAALLASWPAGSTTAPAVNTTGSIRWHDVQRDIWCSVSLESTPAGNGTGLHEFRGYLASSADAPADQRAELRLGFQLPAPIRAEAAGNGLVILTLGDARYSLKVERRPGSSTFTAELKDAHDALLATAEGQGDWRVDDQDNGSVPIGSFLMFTILDAVSTAAGCSNPLGECFNTAMAIGGGPQGLARWTYTCGAAGMSCSIQARD